jgi:hypothetical protein
MARKKKTPRKPQRQLRKYVKLLNAIPINDDDFKPPGDPDKPHVLIDGYDDAMKF